MKTTIYHNPRCSKSRATLELLRERTPDIEVVEYLKTPLSVETLEDIVSKLGVEPIDIVRTGEEAFRESGLAPDSPGGDLIALMAEAPIVMQRPIVVVGDSARIGRPPENALELFD